MKKRKMKAKVGEEVLTKEEIEALRENIELVGNAKDVLFVEKSVLDYWLALSGAFDSVEELQDVMFARFEQVQEMFINVAEKLDKLKEKIAPYEEDK